MRLRKLKGSSSPLVDLLNIAVCESSAQNKRDFKSNLRLFLRISKSDIPQYCLKILIFAGLCTDVNFSQLHCDVDVKSLAM